MRADVGAVDAGLTLTTGEARMDVRRGVVTPTGAAQAQGRQRFDFQSAAALLSRTFGDSSLYVRPSLRSRRPATNNPASPRPAPAA